MKAPLKGFKKVSSDEKGTTFKHVDGHWLRIAHKGLNPDNRKKLDALPPDPDSMNVRASASALNNIPPAYKEVGPGTNFSNVNNMAQGGAIGDVNHPMWHGVKSKIADWAGNGNPGLQTELPQDVKGRPEESSVGTTPDPMSAEEYQKASGPVDSEDITMAKGGMVHRYADGTPGGVVSDADRAASAQRLGMTNYIPAIDAAAVPSDQADAATRGTVGGPSPYALPAGMSDLSQGYETQLGGIQKQQQAAQMGAKANQGLAQQESDLYGTGVNQLNNLNNLSMQHLNSIWQDRQNLMQEMSSGAAHLDPQRFLKNMSTGSKILSGIGLIMGGIGAGMTHGPNLAADFLKRNIDQDVENQRLQLGTKQNLLSFNFQNSKDMQDALATTKLNSIDMLNMYLKRAAAQAQSPLQQSALLNQAGILDQKAGELQNQIAIQRTFRQLGAQQGATQEGTFQQQNSMLRMMGKQGEELAKDRESKHIAGMAGQSSTPLAESDRGGYEEMQNLSKNFQDAQNYLSQVGTLGAPLPGATKAYGEGLMKNMMLSIGKLEDLNRFTHEEGTNYKQMVPDLTGTHFTSHDQGRLNALQQALANKMQTFKQVHGYSSDTKSPAESAPKTASPNEVQRVTKDNKIAIFDGKTKKFLRYK